MSQLEFPPNRSLPAKEKANVMRYRTLKTVLAVAVIAMFALPSTVVAAPSPWWQVLTGSHPTNMWEPAPTELEIETELGEIFGGPLVAVKIEVSGTPVGCLGLKGGFSEIACEAFVGFLPTETAAELETLLKTAFGTEAVEVSGGPVGGENFKVTAS